MAKNDRKYYHYSHLEESKAGLWRKTVGAERKRHIEHASDLMRSPAEFIDAMRQALVDWPNSCAAAFTAEAVNKIAFLGQAGCCVAIGSPEEATRAAWHTLTKQEQDEANAAAALVLNEWYSIHAKPERTLFDA